MLAKRVIACLDVANGRVVKGVNFLGLRDAGDPVEAARTYCAQGVDELVLLDVTATNDRRASAYDTVAAVSAVIDVPLTVGGGVRDVADVARLLDAGADKVAINSAAVADPSLLTRAAERFGTQCVVISVDARRTPAGYEIATHSAAVRVPRDPIAWALQAQELGAGEVLLTSIDRDGTQRGFDTDLLAAARAALRVPIVASGGAGDLASFAEAYAAGADAALAASVFHDGMLRIAEVKSYCAARGVRVRA
ncbi:MAG: imidazole glycerol phosphate synthase subunit HisF [bacterium]|nr:imidazole glycerol phosphate synthase subunit HisF [bacterium]